MSNRLRRTADAANVRRLYQMHNELFPVHGDRLPTPHSLQGAQDQISWQDYMAVKYGIESGGSENYTPMVDRIEIDRRAARDRMKYEERKRKLGKPGLLNALGY